MSRQLERLLVAGGAGFIGSNFVRWMLDRHPGIRITVLDKLTYAGNLENLAGLDVDFVQGDICDRGVVERLSGEVEAIVNFAAETHVDRSLMDPFAFVQTDVYGTAVLCEAARAHGHAAFLLVSTDEVYGDVPEGRSRETDRLAPRSPYSASKAGAEHIAMAYHTSFGLPVLITRGSNTYGPYQFPEKAVPLFITNALDGLDLPLYNDGSAVRDYMHVDDHCRAIALVLAEGTPGEAYNVGTAVETSGNDLAAMVTRHAGAGQIQYVADRPGHDYRYALDTAKIQGLGWQPQIAVEAGVAATVEWYREHQEWWRPLRSESYWEYYRRNYRPLESR